MFRAVFESMNAKISSRFTYFCARYSMAYFLCYGIMLIIKSLTRLAEIFYGRKNAPDVVKAWKCFEEGYKNYPLNIMFSYYGPMHDSVAWHLSLIPKNKELPRSWLVVDKFDGDRMSDCLFYGHTLDEAIILTSKMSDLWKKGLSYLKGDDKAWSVERAVGLLFESGNNILKFYRLREELAHGSDDKLKILCRMESIVSEEIENSKAMIKLCKIDNTLGKDYIVPKEFGWLIPKMPADGARV